MLRTLLRNRTTGFFPQKTRANFRDTEFAGPCCDLSRYTNLRQDWRQSVLGALPSDWITLLWHTQ